MNGRMQSQTTNTVLSVVDREGCEHQLRAREGESLMLLLNRAGLGVDGVCGGCCICATCHIYVEDPQGQLPPMDIDEAMLLDGLLARSDHSRLACQLSSDDIPDGQTIRIAPAE